MVSTKTWIVRDKNSRHPNLHGETVPITALFSNGLHYPTEVRGDPSEYVNCQCTISIKWSLLDLVAMLLGIDKSEKSAVPWLGEHYHPHPGDHKPPTGSEGPSPVTEMVDDKISFRGDPEWEGKWLNDTEAVLEHYGPEGQALADYMGANYYDLLIKFRKGETLTASDKDRIQALDALFELDDSKIPVRTILFRGVRVESNVLNVGDVFVTKGWSSFSIDPDVADTYANADPRLQGVVLQVEVYQGEKALFGDPENAEVILPRNLQWFVTEKYFDDELGKEVVKLELRRGQEEMKAVKHEGPHLGDHYHPHPMGSDPSVVSQVREAVSKSPKGTVRQTVSQWYGGGGQTKELRLEPEHVTEGGYAKQRYLVMIDDSDEVIGKVSSREVLVSVPAGSGGRLRRDLGRPTKWFPEFPDGHESVIDGTREEALRELLRRYLQKEQERDEQPKFEYTPELQEHIEGYTENGISSRLMEESAKKAPAILPRLFKGVAFDTAFGRPEMDVQGAYEELMSKVEIGSEFQAVGGSWSENVQVSYEFAGLNEDGSDPDDDVDTPSGMIVRPGDPKILFEMEPGARGLHVEPYAVEQWQYQKEWFTGSETYNVLGITQDGTVTTVKLRQNLESEGQKHWPGAGVGAHFNHPHELNGGMVSGPTSPNDDNRTTVMEMLADKIAEIQGFDRNNLLEEPLDWGDDTHLKAQLTELFNHEFEDFDSQVGKVEVLGDYVKIEGGLYEVAGPQIGLFKREIHKNATGDYVINELMKVFPEYQGQGIATEFNDRSFQQYKKWGFDHVELDANISVGGYAWAVRGFDFADDSQVTVFLDAIDHFLRKQTDPGDPLRQEYQLLREKAESGQHVSARDIAMFGADGPKFSAVVDYESGQIISMEWEEDGDRWVGKHVLLGSSWLGVLAL